MVEPAVHVPMLNKVSEMRITDIESIVLQHEMDEELGFAQGYYSKRTAHLVKVHTDDGITGLGEIFGAGNFAFANQAILKKVGRNKRSAVPAARAYGIGNSFCTRSWASGRCEITCQRR
jgi:hypothetical protein